VHRVAACDGGNSTSIEKKKKLYLDWMQVPDVADAMAAARVLLAPLRFGAGLKGKVCKAHDLQCGYYGDTITSIFELARGTYWLSCKRSIKVVEAWVHGLPVVTTPIGAEGMVASNYTHDCDREWGGSWTSVTADAFAEAAVRL